MFDLFLLCILFSSSCCFWFLLLSYFVIFSILATYQKTSLKKLEIAKNPKMKNAQKRTFWQEQLAQVCSQIVSFFSFLCFFKFSIFCWKHYKNRGFSKTWKNKKPSVKNWSKLALKTGPSMLRNKIGPVFNARNVVFFGFFFFFFFFEKSSSFCRDNEIFKNKKTKKTKKLDQLLTLEKANIGPAFNSTAYIYMTFDRASANIFVKHWLFSHSL